jgi:hypothetical protein
LVERAVTQEAFGAPGLQGFGAPKNGVIDDPSPPPARPADDARQQKIMVKGPCVSATYDPHHRYSRSTLALAMTSKHPPGPPMDLANMRDLRVRHQDSGPDHRGWQ